MSSTSAAPDTSTWPTMTQAAVILATGERTVRRWIDSDKLHSAIREVPGRKPLVIVNPEDVEKLRTARNPVVMRQDADTAPHESESPPASNDTGLRLSRPASGAFAGGDPFAGLAVALARAFPSPAPVQVLTPGMMTLSEAVEYYRVPGRYLVNAARAGTIRAVNVGLGKTEKWRFARA